MAQLPQQEKQRRYEEGAAHAAARMASRIRAKAKRHGHHPLELKGGWEARTPELVVHLIGVVLRSLPRLPVLDDDCLSNGFGRFVEVPARGVNEGN